VSPPAGTPPLRAGHDAFEDGTIDFLGIPAVIDGLDFLDGVGMDAVHDRVAFLTDEMLSALATRRHGCGAPLVRIHGPCGNGARGGTVAFNVLEPDGRVVPYRVIERAAADAGVSIRGGCFCNPGASEAAFGFPADRTGACFERVAAGGLTPERLAACLGVAAVGAVRASVGIASDASDIARLVSVLLRFRCSAAGRRTAPGPETRPDSLA
jgi:selenocysteine lyase/cysteine desulfurase